MPGVTTLPGGSVVIRTDTSSQSCATCVIGNALPIPSIILPGVPFGDARLIHHVRLCLMWSDCALESPDPGTNAGKRIVLHRDNGPALDADYLSAQMSDANRVY
jgi:hypothetical protein